MLFLYPEATDARGSLSLDFFSNGFKPRPHFSPVFVQAKRPGQVQTGAGQAAAASGAQPRASEADLTVWSRPEISIQVARRRVCVSAVDMPGHQTAA